MTGSIRRAVSTQAALLAVLLYLAAACGGDGDGDAPTDPGPSAVADLEVSPSSATLTAVGDTQQFEATATDASGAEVSGVTFSWTSSDSDVATVDSDGTAVARASGSVTIEAEARGETGSADLTVDQEVADLEVSPDSAAFDFVGDTQRFEAEARDANDNPIEDPDLSWASSDMAVVTVDASGLARSTGGGTAQVEASAAGTDVSTGAPVTVPEQLFEGPPDARVEDHIPDESFPDPDTADFTGEDGMYISRRGGLVVFADGVTVGEANDLFAAYAAEVTGGWPAARLAGIRFPDRTLSEALTLSDSLRSDSRTASFALEIMGQEPTALPPRENTSAWDWSASGAGNWYLHRIRAPQFWNLDDFVRRHRSGRSGCSLVVEFQPGPDAGHPDMQGVYPGGTPNGAGPGTTLSQDSTADHFTLTTGLTGAAWRDGSGVGSVNPWADSVFVRTGTASGPFMNHLRFANNTPCIHAVNASYGWTNPHGNARLQNRIRNNGNNLQNTLNNLAAAGNLRNDLLLVWAAGNDGGRAAQWKDYGTFASIALNDPRILTVEASDTTDTRAGFSNTGGQLSAPGTCIRGPEANNNVNYDRTGSCGGARVDGGGDNNLGTNDGTSFSAPQVVALATALWEIEPSLSRANVRNLLTSAPTTEAVNPGGAPGRIDGFAAAMGIDGANGDNDLQKSLVDVDDGTRDGHLRSKVYPEDPSSGSFHTDDGIRGDGRVDMADLRVLRDAWTQLHVHTDERELDGGVTNPWKDLNRDGCVGGSQASGLTGTIPCGAGPSPVTPEARFPRFDFNGNGYIHRLADRVRSEAPDSALAPFKVDPDNACASAAPGCLRDLDVLEQMWEGRAGRENVNAAGDEDISCTTPSEEEWNPTALLADRDDDGSVDYMHSFDVHFRVPGGATSVPPEEDDEDLFHAETFPFDDGTPNGAFASYNLHGADRLFVKCRFDPAENAEVTVPVAETGPGINYVVWQKANEEESGSHRAVENESTLNWIKIGFEPEHGEDFGFGAIYDSDLEMESTSRGLSDDWFVVAREVVFRDRQNPGENTDAYDVWDTSEGTVSECLRTETRGGEDHADTPFHQAMLEKADEVWVRTEEASPVSLLKQWVGADAVVTSLPIASHHDPASCSDTPDGFQREKGKLWGVWLQVNSVE